MQRSTLVLRVSLIEGFASIRGMGGSEGQPFIGPGLTSLHSIVSAAGFARAQRAAAVMCRVAAMRMSGAACLAPARCAMRSARRR